MKEYKEANIKTRELNKSKLRLLRFNFLIIGFLMIGCKGDELTLPVFSENLTLPTFSENIVFEEFNQDCDWELKQTDAASMTLENGGLVVEKFQKSTENNFCLWYAKNIETFDTSSDFSMEFDVEIIEGSQDYIAEFDIAWGQISGKEKSFYQFTLSDKGVCRINKFDNTIDGKYWSYLKEITLLNVNEGDVNHINIIQHQGEMLVMFNEKEIFEFQTSTVQGEDIGFITCQKVKWQLDNLKITDKVLPQ
ncbi:hypothetical protein [Flammeovirga agarivorans]|uniref:3-keto-disaccharide hydrolase domain-containing protein n=1 Tax=Flammeovirga agarivorans TaxID=2726742 RepID=A0A7X8XXJ3_9BACT|nr:hypothetical protein [Flammeovirga agarivorans]NLR93304.1 hypothetical protein [Flammeovirga agarivorans]